jgi:uncharacterized protein (TIGR00297 family)
LILRASIGGALSVIVVILARMTRTLSTTGAIAAALLGTACLAAGWSCGVFPLSLFVSASVLSRIGRRRKAARTGSIVEKGGERDATQVLANGGVFAGAALAQIAFPSPLWFAVGAGAIAASTADTWATEIGTLVGRDPISILTGQRVPAGTSGAITWPGTLGGAAGALFIAAEATFATWPVAFAAVAVGGIAGSLADSLLGASIQARRWCDVCAVSTERLVHSCGNPTRPDGGVEGIDNDVVNAVCSGVGALVALGLTRVM